MRFFIHTTLFALVLALPAVHAEDSGVSKRDEAPSIHFVDLSFSDREAVCAKSQDQDTSMRLGCWKLGSNMATSDSVALSADDFAKVCDSAKNTEAFERLGCSKSKSERQPSGA